MSLVIATQSALSVAANSKSADVVSGTYQYNGAGVYTLIAKASATGLNCTCTIGGVSPVNDAAIPFTGTAGTISTRDNVIFSQFMMGGRAELTFRNTTGGAITIDCQLLYDAPLASLASRFFGGRGE